MFDGEEHVRIATLPGMWDRTVTVGSAGSTSHAVMRAERLIDSCPHSEMFAATGWRVGWVIGPASVIQPTLAATTRIVFCSNSPLQEASAVGIEQAKKRGFLAQQCKEYQERRDILTNGFDKLGMKYTNPQGAYFVLLVSASFHVNTCRTPPAHS